MSSASATASATVPEQTLTAPATSTDGTQEYDEDSLPPAPLKLSHSLSHVDACFSDAMQYADVCKEGEIVLMNYYVSVNNWATITYLTKVNGQMIEGGRTGWKQDIPVFWQYDSCAFKWNEEIF